MGQPLGHPKGGELEMMMAVQGPRVPFHAIYLGLQSMAPRRIGEPRMSFPSSFNFGQETKASLGNGLGTWVFVLLCFVFSCQGYTDTGQMTSYLQEGQS